MNYSDCLTYLERLGNEVLTMKFGLDTIRALLRDLGNPHRQYPCILVAGTNGKGSTARFIDSVCRSAGIRTGLFTSPHLVRIEERIRISTEQIDPAEFARHFSHVVASVRRLQPAVHPTFFEIITATALNCFAARGIDLAVLEIGMGGRLDSTNAVDPILSVLTPISYDHQQFLGESLTRIAAEKAGILRPGTLAVSAPQVTEAARTLEEKAHEIGARLEFVDPEDIRILDKQSESTEFALTGERFRLNVPGEFQAVNAAVALRTVRALQEAGFSISRKAVRQGLESAQIPGVLQVFNRNPPVILDGGHNPQAIESLVEHLQKWTLPPRTLVFGMMRDKPIGQIFPWLAPLFTSIYLTRADRVRSASPDELQRFCPAGITMNDPGEAFQRAVSGASAVVVAGSLHLVGAILRSVERCRQAGTGS